MKHNYDEIVTEALKGKYDKIGTLTKKDLICLIGYLLGMVKGLGGGNK